MKQSVFFFLLGCSMSLYAQDSLFQLAEHEFQQADYHAAYQHFKASTDPYRLSGQLNKYALCNLRMAECYLALGEPGAAQGIVSSTYEYVNDVLPQASQLKATALSISGNGYLQSGRNDLALEQLEKAKALFTKNTLAAAECFENLGIVYWNNGNKALALQHHERALEIRENAPIKDRALLADSYINIGLIYLKDEPLQSIIYFNRSLSIYQEIYGNNHPKVAFCYSNIAFARAYLGNYDEALEYLDLVGDIWSSTYAGDHPNKAYVLSNKGRIYEMKGALDEALLYQQEALQMYLRLYGAKHPEVANTYFLIGSVYQKKDAFKTAAENYQRSVYANLFNQEFESLYDLPEIRDYYNADILLSSLQAKAKALEALHYEKSLKLADIDGALQTYRVCDELISRIRQLRLDEADKLRLGAIAADVYENGIDIAVFLSERTFRKGHYLRQAFDFCERSKSAVLLEAINETKARHFAGIPDRELALEDSLKNEISYLEQKLAQAKSPGEEDPIKKRLFRYQSSLRDFISRLEQDHPEYYKLKYNQQLADADELQSILPENTAVLSYFTGNDRLYAFLLTRDRYKVFSLKKAPDFDKNISGLRNAIRYRVPSAYVSIAHALYEQLIPKIPRNIRSLVIIPDGRLGTVPFGALLTEVPEEGTRPHYLLRDYSISYDYSATLLKDRITEKRDDAAKGILLAAPVSFDRNEIALQRLPDSEKEVKEIRYLFAGTGQDVKTTLHETASESLIKSEEISEYRFLHFATHGVINESKPEMSRIFLSPDEQEDGSLYAGELYNLTVRADLITLSACETGLGKIARGEGIVGLSRALLYAGARNLVVSLWQVADASTARLMIEFYKQHLHHSDNSLYADDLRKAQLSLLDSGDYPDPYYWAPFILVGL